MNKLLTNVAGSEIVSGSGPLQSGGSTVVFGNREIGDSLRWNKIVAVCHSEIKSETRPIVGSVEFGEDWLRTIYRDRTTSRRWVTISPYYVKIRSFV